MINRSLLLCSSVIVAFSTAGAAPRQDSARDDQHWIGTWAAAPQAARPADAQTFQNQTLRLIVHTSAGGKRVRVKFSNVFGDRPLVIGSAHLARRAAGGDIEAASDRSLTFGGRHSIDVATRSSVASDAVDLDVPPLSDVAVSVFFPQSVSATTFHSLARQTNYLSAATGDYTSAATFPTSTTVTSWPFLTGVDVAASSAGAAIVAFGSSTTDGDGSTKDANRRWPDVLAERLQKASGGSAEIGVLNEGIIGNRLLFDSPGQPDNPFGPVLGEAGLARFDRDVLSQSGVKYVLICLGVNDILFPAFPFTPPAETASTGDIIDGYRQLVGRAHRAGVRVIGTTIPPFEGATFDAAGLKLSFYTVERERVRLAVNDWIRRGRGFDGVADFDEAVRDLTRPSRLLQSYAAPDHLHVNDAGNVAQGYVVPLALFRR